MAARQQGIKTDHLLLIGGAVLLWPVIKGLFSLAQLTGDILQGPGKLATALNKETDEAVKDAVYKTLLQFAKSTNYDKNNPDHKKLLSELIQDKDSRSSEIITEWIRWKGVRPGEAAALKAAREKVNNFLKRWL